MLSKRQVYNQRAFVQSKAEGKFPEIEITYFDDVLIIGIKIN